MNKRMFTNSVASFIFVVVAVSGTLTVSRSASAQTVPTGTHCGWSHHAYNGTNTLIAACEGYDPRVGCPSGYTQASFSTIEAIPINPPILAKWGQYYFCISP